MRQVEVWGGIECSVVRISDRYVDQIAMSGHQNRIEDLERFAELGLRRIRYPVVWERVVRDGGSEPDWRWTDQRLLRLRDLGLRDDRRSPPSWERAPLYELADPSFAERFGEFAGRVAERYPWIDLYTPINEPLTTARFSGLYGHWYPHRRDDREFLVDAGKSGAGDGAGHGGDPTHKPGGPAAYRRKTSARRTARLRSDTRPITKTSGVGSASTC